MLGDSWINNGKYAGAHIRRSEELLLNTHDYHAIIITLLDADPSGDFLKIAHLARMSIDDARQGNIGNNSREEREGIASTTAESFKAQWPVMRQRLVQNHLVSLISGFEHFIKSLHVEFAASSQSRDAGISADADWKLADNNYRILQRKFKSTSKNWLAICRELQIPIEVKTRLATWENEHNTTLIDELTLVRNIIMHGAGIPSATDAKKLQRLKFKAGQQIYIDDKLLEAYTDALWRLHSIINDEF